MTFKRILVAVNSPNGRDAAFERALALARSSGAELYLLHAVPVDQRFSSNAGERMRRISQMRTRAEPAGVRVRAVEQQGDAAEIIELHANAADVDLIVIGHEPRHGWRSTRSRVAETVIRRTNVPTLVVSSDAPGDGAAFRHVLVAIDLSPESKDVVASAVGLTAAEALQLTVLHAVNGIEAADAVQSPARWKVPEYRMHVQDDARRRLEAVASEVPANIDTRVRVSTGPAARTILTHAADVEADLVVVGRSRGFTLLGSTALRVLRRNPRPLLVVPSAARRKSQVEQQRAA